ncbi:MAG: hypothetical protein J6S85_06145 [Methanobrevibacter sp.]|nr:hypothetical protein [Methanobrevibacter sp.]
MEIKQIYGFVNDATREAIGESVLLSEDLSNIVDVGKAVISSSDSKDKFINALVNRIGREIFVNRKYEGFAPKLIRDAWTYGSIKMKVSGRLKEAQENETWELQDGTSYDPNVFYGSDVVVKFYNKRTTYEVPISIGEIQLEQSFTNATSMSAFIDMLFNNIETSMTIKNDEVLLRTINNMIIETIHDDFGANALNSKSGVKAINLLYEYNTNVNGGTPLTKDNCLYDKEFLRYATQRIALVIGRLKRASKLFNIGGEVRFTPKDRLYMVMLDDLKTKTDTYLSSDTFHDELVKLPNADTTPYWQGSGQNYEFSATSHIKATSSEGNSLDAYGILACAFDIDALGVSNEKKRVTSNYNGKAEFFNYWNKMDAEYWNDFNENFIVFFVQ